MKTTRKRFWGRIGLALLIVVGVVYLYVQPVVAQDGGFKTTISGRGGFKRNAAPANTH